MDEAGEGDAKLIQVTHDTVFPFVTASNAQDAGKPFIVESLCTVKQVHIYNMADERPRIVVVAVRYNLGVPTLLAERVFSVTEPGEVYGAFHSEQEGWWRLFQTSGEQCSQKRKATDLLDPFAKKAPKLVLNQTV